MKETVAGQPQSCAGASRGRCTAGMLMDPLAMRAGRRARARSRMRHGGRSSHHAASRPTCRAALLFLLGRVPSQVPGRPGEISRAIRDDASPYRAGEAPSITCPMHPQIRQVGPGRLPDLRHGARARARRGRRRRRIPKLADMTRRFWIGARARAAGAWSLEMGGASRQPAHDRRPDLVELAPVRVRDAGGAVGAAGRSSCAAGNRSSRAISTCSR